MGDEYVDITVRVPKGYMLVPESKSERLNLLVTKTIKHGLQMTAKKRKTSLNDLVNQILLNWLTIQSVLDDC